MSAQLFRWRHDRIAFDAVANHLTAALPSGGTAFVSTPAAWHACRVESGALVRRDGSRVAAADSPFDVRAFADGCEFRWRRSGDGGVGALVAARPVDAMPDGWAPLDGAVRVTTVLDHTYRVWGTVDEVDGGWTLVHENRIDGLWLPMPDGAVEGDELVLASREYLGTVLGADGDVAHDGMVVSIEEILTGISTGGRQ